MASGVKLAGAVDRSSGIRITERFLRPLWVESGKAVAASTKMPRNIRIHLTGYSGLRPPPLAGDAGR
jgi:hypothetical protein